MADITQVLQVNCGQLDIKQDASRHLKKCLVLILKLLNHAPDTNGNIHTQVTLSHLYANVYINVL